MITVPSYAARFIADPTAPAHWVVKIAKGSNTWLFSDIDMVLSDGHVFPILLPGLVFQSAVDLQRKYWSVQDVEIRLSTIPYKQKSAATGRKSFVDEAGDLTKANVTIYLLLGPGPTALSDGIIRFAGKLVDGGVVRGNQIALRAVDGISFVNKKIPDGPLWLNATYGGVPYPDRLRMTPEVWGEFTKTYDNTADLGLVRGEKLSPTQDKVFIFANHAAHTMTDVFVGHPDFLPLPSKMLTATKTANDSGYATAKFTGNAMAVLPTESSDAGSHSIGTNSMKNVGNAGDFFPSTYASVYYTGSGFVTLEGVFSFRDYAPGELNQASILGKIIGTTSGGNQVAYVDFKAAEQITLTGTHTREVYMNFGTNTWKLGDWTNSSNHTFEIQFGTGSGQCDWLNDIVWHLASGDSSGSSDIPFCISIQAGGTMSAGDSGKEVLRVYWCNLRVEFKPRSIDVAWAAMKGRKFGSWVTANGRSNGYGTSDFISDPAMIIESILRDILGLGDSDIDIPSFDAALNSNVAARLFINHDDRRFAMDIIRELAEQSTFAFAISAGSKARLIDLVTTPTPTRYIKAAEIVLETFEFAADTPIIDAVHVKHRWMAEHNSFMEYYQYDPGYPEHVFNAEWKNITDSFGAVFEVADFLRTFWATPRTRISMELRGYRNIDIETGDSFYLPAELDSLLKNYGASWTDGVFMTTQVTQTDTGLRITAIDVS